MLEVPQTPPLEAKKTSLSLVQRNPTKMGNFTLWDQQREHWENDHLKMYFRSETYISQSRENKFVFF